MEQEPANTKNLGQEVLDDLKNNPVVVFFDKLFEKTNHRLIIPIAAFFDALLVILPLEFMAVGYALKHKKTDVFRIAIYSGITSTVGAVLVYYLGYAFFPFLDSVFNLSGSDSYTYFQSVFFNHQVLLVISSAFFSTIPFTPLCLLSGFFGIDILIFTLGTWIARTLRLYLVMFFTKRWGIAIIEKFFTRFIFASVLMTIGIIYFVFFR